MMTCLWDCLAQNWKTTLAGLLTAMCETAVLTEFIPPEYHKKAQAICFLLVASGLIAAKDGNVSHSPTPKPVAEPVNKPAAQP